MLLAKLCCKKIEGVSASECGECSSGFSCNKVLFSAAPTHTLVISSPLNRYLGLQSPAPHALFSHPERQQFDGSPMNQARRSTSKEPSTCKDMEAPNSSGSYVRDSSMSMGFHMLQLETMGLPRRQLFPYQQILTGTCEWKHCAQALKLRSRRLISTSPTIMMMESIAFTF